MNYSDIVKGRFIRRPNRYIAEVDIGGSTVVCHVKNTGRCRELLTEGATVILEHSVSATRKTAYDLISVYKGTRLISIDSQAPNRVFHEWIASGKLFDNVTLIKPETGYGSSRFDFYIEANDRKIFAEVKGVTLEDNGTVSFPDAPTERGTKHIKELIKAVNESYDAYITFVIQMKDCKRFVPNEKTDPSFSEALRDAYSAGVNILCLSCNVTEGSLCISDDPYVSFTI